MDHFDREKFKALVLYVIWRTGEVRDFGATKLNKVLWFSDARAFEALGKSVTGETYVRQKFGPVPRHINAILRELQEEGLVVNLHQVVHSVRSAKLMSPNVSDSRGRTEWTPTTMPA